MDAPAQEITQLATQFKKRSTSERYRRKIKFLVQDNEDLEDFVIDLLGMLDTISAELPADRARYIHSKISPRRQELDFPPRDTAGARTLGRRKGHTSGLRFSLRRLRFDVQLTTIPTTDRITMTKSFHVTEVEAGGEA